MQLLMAEVGQTLVLGDGARLEVLVVVKRGAVVGAGRFSSFAATPEWIEKLRLQVVLLSVAEGDGEGGPDAEVFKAVEG